MSPPPPWVCWVLIGGGAGRILATAFFYRRRRRRAIRRFARLRRSAGYRQVRRVNPVFIEWIERWAVFHARSPYARWLAFALGALLIGMGAWGLWRA